MTTTSGMHMSRDCIYVTWLRMSGFVALSEGHCMNVCVGMHEIIPILKQSDDILAPTRNYKLSFNQFHKLLLHQIVSILSRYEQHKMHSCLNTFFFLLKYLWACFQVLLLSYWGPLLSYGLQSVPARELPKLKAWPLVTLAHFWECLKSFASFALLSLWEIFTSSTLICPSIYLGFFSFFIHYNIKVYLRAVPNTFSAHSILILNDAFGFV